MAGNVESAGADDTTLKGLERFDECRNYAISDEKEQELIGREIDRLGFRH